MEGCNKVHLHCLEKEERQEMDERLLTFYRRIRTEH